MVVVVVVVVVVELSIWSSNSASLNSSSSSSSSSSGGVHYEPTELHSTCTNAEWLSWSGKGLERAKWPTQGSSWRLFLFFFGICQRQVPTKDTSNRKMLDMEMHDHPSIKT